MKQCTQMMSTCFRRVKVNLNDTASVQKRYHDLRAKERSFEVGDKTFVHFPNVPAGTNQKFYKLWRGVYTVVRKIGKLNLELSLHPGSSDTIIVHVDRVRRASDDERRSEADTGKRGEENEEQEEGGKMKCKAGTGSKAHNVIHNHAKSQNEKTNIF